MPQDTRILIVDDDATIRALLEASLNSIGYETVAAHDGREAQKILFNGEQQIDAVVSDVLMPEMDGYELCQSVRDNQDTAHLPFIFLSGRTSLEEMLKGFGVGGDEYINKPLDPQETILKIQRIIECKLQHIDRDQQLEQSSKVAFQAMTYTSYLGQVLEFLQKALQAKSYQELATLVFEVTSSWGLNCNLQFHTPSGVLDLNTQGQVSPLESNVMELTRNKGRFFDFAHRTIINYDDFSLLVKNMPVDDEQRYGQIKDLLGNLCNAINAEVKVLNSSGKLENKDNIINAVNTTIEEVNQTFHAVSEDSSEAITFMMDELEEAMLTQLGLTEEQEETIRLIANEMKQRTSKNFAHFEELLVKLNGVRESLVEALKE